MDLQIFAIIVLSFITLCTSKISPNFNKNFLTNRIYNCNDAEIGEAPYIVSLRCTPHGKNFCAGSIISERVVLTAAHCLHDRIYIVAGMHKQNNETGTQIVKVIKKVQHEEFDANDKVGPYDIALLFLAKTLNFNSLVQAIELPKSDTKVSGEGKIYGWGITTIFEVIPNILQTTTTDILPYTECKAQVHSLCSSENNLCNDLLELNSPIHPTNICAVSRNNSACSGNSGAPLVKIVDGKPILVGIASFACPLCGLLGFPAGYTSTVLYLKWIEVNEAEFLNKSKLF